MKRARAVPQHRGKPVLSFDGGELEMGVTAPTPFSTSAYRAVHPPSTMSRWPVVAPADGLAR